jgi:hypothetical protein
MYSIVRYRSYNEGRLTSIMKHTREVVGIHQVPQFLLYKEEEGFH